MTHSSSTASRALPAEDGGLRYPGTGWTTLHQAVQTGWSSSLGRFLVVLMAVCAVACLYMWLASSVTSLRASTDSTKRLLTEVERSTSELLIQKARWDSPAYVYAQALRRGLEPGALPVYVRLAPGTGPVGSGDPPAALWSRTSGWLASWTDPARDGPGVTRTAQRP